MYKKAIDLLILKPNGYIWKSRLCLSLARSSSAHVLSLKRVFLSIRPLADHTPSSHAISDQSMSQPLLRLPPVFQAEEFQMDSFNHILAPRPWESIRERVCFTQVLAA